MGESGTATHRLANRAQRRAGERRAPGSRSQNTGRQGQAGGSMAVRGPGRRMHLPDLSACAKGAYMPSRAPSYCALFERNEDPGFSHAGNNVGVRSIHNWPSPVKSRACRYICTTHANIKCPWHQSPRCPPPYQSDQSCARRPHRASASVSARKFPASVPTVSFSSVGPALTPMLSWPWFTTSVQVY